MITALAILLVLWLAWFAREFITAPMGYEDKDGFHYGAKP